VVFKFFKQKYKSEVNMKKRQVLLNDVSLREGAQVLRGSMEFGDQIKYVKKLIDHGIDMIEIGYPSSSAKALENCIRIREFVNEYCICKNMKMPLLSGLARANENDINTVKETGCDVCHIYIPSSDNLMMAMFSSEKYGTSESDKRDWVINQAVNMVGYAKSLGFKSVEYSPEDAARTGFEYLSEIVRSVIEAGAGIVNIPDTTGLRILDEYGNLISKLFENVPNIKKAVISVHCHNDSDCSVSNALWAISKGATQIEGTFFGLGERSGMTKFESIIMVIMSRPDIFEDVYVNFDPSACKDMVELIANSLGMTVPRHWPVVGQQNFVCNSGTHQAVEARAKEQGMGSAYYSWNPAQFGNCGVENVINSYSGREGLRDKLKELGYGVSKLHLDAIYKKVTRISDSKGGASLKDREITAVVEDIIGEVPFPINIEHCQVLGGGGTIPNAAVVIEAGGRRSVNSSPGNGPFDALMFSILNASSEIYDGLKGVEFVLEDWRIRNLTDESKSLADFFTRIQIIKNAVPQGSFSGRAVSPDTIQAAAESFAKCLSWYLASL
jgi:2-isopropylmalate synthase